MRVPFQRMMLEISQDITNQLWQSSPPASTQAVCVFQLGVGTSMEEMFADVALMCAHITREFLSQTYRQLVCKIAVAMVC